MTKSYFQLFFFLTCLPPASLAASTSAIESLVTHFVIRGQATALPLPLKVKPVSDDNKKSLYSDTMVMGWRLPQNSQPPQLALCIRHGRFPQVFADAVIRKTSSDDHDRTLYSITPIIDRPQKVITIEVSDVEDVDLPCSYLSTPQKRLPLEKSTL